MADISAQMIIGLLIAILMVVAVALPVLTQVIDDVTTLSATTNESHNLTGGLSYSMNLTNFPLTSGSLVLTTNTSGVLVLNTNYTIISNALGQAQIISYNISDNGTSLFASYTYQGDSYITSGITRTIVNFIPLFIAIAGLLIVAVFVGDRSS